MSRAYLDHASTSPTRPEALAAMRAWFDGDGADPGRIHAEGMTSRVQLESAREQVADLVGARAREVVFTSGATEAIAAACFGAVRREPARTHMVVAPVEHSAVREWAARGPVTEVGVDRHGAVDPAEVMDAIRDDTALVHLQWGNHEVGTLQPVDELARLMGEHGCRARGVLLHVDAAQAAGRVPVDVRASDVDLLSLSGHKFGGPPGTGALVVRRGLRLAPLMVGGDQERARRAGMENVPALLGLGAAAAATRVDSEMVAARELTDEVRRTAPQTDGVRLLGDPRSCVPHIVCLGFADVEPQAVVLELDRAGVAVHSGSSCSTEAIEPSPVLMAMGVDAERSLRISVGWNTTPADVERFLGALPVVLARLRSLRT